MSEFQAKFCLLDYDLNPSAEVVVPAEGKDLCVRSSGKLSAAVSGSGEQRTTKRAISKAAHRILGEFFISLQLWLWVGGRKEVR